MNFLPELTDHAPAGSVPRSSHWPACRAAHLKVQPKCAACGGVLLLQVHHMAPFHLHPELELSESNLITLCERPGLDCHLKIGHLGDWHKFNPNVIEDAAKRRATMNAEPTGALFPKLREHNIARIKTILAKEGFTSDEVDGAMSEAEGDHPFLDLFTTYILPFLLTLLKNLILAKRAAGV